MHEDVVQVFHRWNATLDAESRTVTFFVSKEFAESEEDVDNIDVNLTEMWDKVMVLPFPDDKVGEVEGTTVAFAGTPIFFDHTQLSKRFIPVDEFVDAVTRIVSKINEDLSKQVALESMHDDSGWNVL